MADNIEYWVWDREFNEADSGPYRTREEAERHTYVPELKPTDDPAKFRPSKSLEVREETN